MSYPLIKSLVVLGALLVAGFAFGKRTYELLWLNLRLGRPSRDGHSILKRIEGVIVYVAGQLRLFRFLIPGTSHFFIFWGFVILLPTILLAMAEGLFAFTWPEGGPGFLSYFGPLAFLQDLFAVFVIVAVVYDLYQRIVVKPERYAGSHRGQGVMVLLFIMTIMVSLLVMNGIRINLGSEPLAAWRPVSSAVGRLFAGMSEGAQGATEEAAYWVHLLVVLVFLVELPGGKHFHVVTSIPAVFLRNLGPRGRLPAAAEHDGDVGAGRVQDFTWRQMLDFYTCTECGRCQEVCPAYASGLPLSPKLLMMGLRDHLMAVGDSLRVGGASTAARPKEESAASDGSDARGSGAGTGSADTGGTDTGGADTGGADVADTSGANGSVLPGALIGDAVSEEALWACTTCYACDQECPLFIEHVTPIVDMRRHLVIEGQMDDMLQEALANVGRYGNSFGKSGRARARWTKGREPAVTDARKEPVEYLWFVGDYASYSPTLTDVTLKTASLFEAAGLEFGILYDAERNARNDVRRVGEEGLFEMLVEKNMAGLARCEYSAIVTTDPHSFNTLKNEYPWDPDAPPRVMHYSELLEELIASGHLVLGRQLGRTVTYHDPCYLGRYNGVYEAPRRVIAAAGCRLVEMPRSRDRALCCGAGGGRIWMDEGEVSERPSEERVREAASLPGVEAMIVACPKDVTMYRDAVKTTGLEDSLEILDLAEIVYEALSR
jgi:Fe-S oxidoreductase